MDGYSRSLERIKSYTTRGLEEFSRHPVSYTTNSIRELVRDNWDLGAAVLVGTALADKDSQIFGQYREALGIISSAATVAGAVSRDFDLASDRYLKNTAVILASYLFSENEFIIPKIVAVPFVLGAIAMERLRRRRKQEILKSQKSSPLETELIHSDTAST